VSDQLALQIVKLQQELQGKKKWCDRYLLIVIRDPYKKRYE
jgi:hypothetical protein